MDDTTKRADDDDLLTPEEVAAWTKYAVATLAKLRCMGGGPAFVYPGGGRIVRYRRGDVRAWIGAPTASTSGTRRRTKEAEAATA